MNDDAKESDGERLGRAVLALRTLRDDPQEALAQRAGVSRAWLSRLERGLIPNPKATPVDAVAQALNFRDGNDVLRLVYGHDRYAKHRAQDGGQEGRDE